MDGGVDRNVVREVWENIDGGTQVSGTKVFTWSCVEFL